VTVNDPIYKHTDPDGDTLTIRTPGVGGRYQAVARDESGDPVCVYVTPEVLREAADAIEKHRREAKYLNAIRGIEALLRDGISHPVPEHVIRRIWDIGNRALGHTSDDDGFSYYVDRARGLEEALTEIRDAILTDPTTGEALTVIQGIVRDALKGDR
jgi:hypothetical protein